MAKVCRSSILVACLLVSHALFAQVVERNINMVAGQDWPGGDPFLRQQNEPSIAVSAMNPLTLFAVGNDYRTVDIAFTAPPRPDDEQTGDAWIGYFISTDGGNRWLSFLLDGYPQQVTTNSPLKGFQAAADPVVRAGNHGMFYVSGIVTNRGSNPLSGVFVARFVDNNNRESVSKVQYLDTKMIASGTAGQFIDKPWLAVDPKPNGLQCTVNGVSFPAQNLYLAYTIFVGGTNNIRTKMMFARSQNCGATWQNATKLSETFPINQGAVIAVDPNSNNVYVAWRQFASGNDPNAIVLAKSTDGGATFPKANLIKTITPFEQGTGNFNIRTNAYPTMAVDNTGRVYVAWSERIPQTPTPFDPTPTDGRVVMINSGDGGLSWSAATQISNIAPLRGHQFMPTLNFSNGKLTAAWYDLRQDSTVGTYAMNSDGSYAETRTTVGNLALANPQPDVVFWNFMADYSPIAGDAFKLLRRHTLDVYAAEAPVSVMPLPFATTRISRYKFGSWKDTNGHLVAIQDLQINPPNLPMFAGGTVPFIGDYIDLTSYQNQAATLTSTPSRIRHVVWTDNRDVRTPPGTPPNWALYTPVHSASLGSKSLFDPSQNTIPCGSGPADATGSRNQNLYTSRITDGLFAGAPGNAKQLNIARAFTVFAQNARNTVTTYRFTVAQPSPGTASFVQSGPVVSTVFASIQPHSTATRTVFVANAPLHAKVDVSVVEVTGPGGADVSNGLSTVVTLNPDPLNPDIGNPDIGNPDIGNTEIFNPDIGNPDIGNPDIGNPDIGNPDIGNPDIGNPDIGNPDIGNPNIGNPDIGNPDIGNPDIGNPDIGNGSVTDTTWTTENTGNTTGGYTVKLASTTSVPSTLISQFILHKIYDTPVARGCNLGVEHNRQVLSSSNTLPLTNPNDGDPSLKDPNTQTLWLAPHEKGYITVRLIDPVNKGLTLDASQFVTPIVISHSANTGTSLPSVALGIAPRRIPDAIINSDSYTAQLQAIGGLGTKTFSGGAGLPANMSLSPTGLVSGSPATTGSFPFTVTVTDSRQSKTTTIEFHVTSRLFITTESVPNGSPGTPYAAAILSNGGGVPPYAWSVADGTLPPGLTLSPTTGLISGTPTTSGSYGFTVKLTDASFPSAQSAFGQYSIQILAPLFLSFVEQPSSAIEGSTTTGVQVLARDASNAPVPNALITLNLGVSPCGVTQADQTATTGPDGIALFPAQTTPDACYGYTFRATGAAAGFLPAVKDTNPFDSFGFGPFAPTNFSHGFGLTATRLNDGRILVTGGGTTRSATNAAEVWDPQAFKWVAVGNMNEARLFHTATLLADGRVLIAGGRLLSQASNTIEFFDPTTNTFTMNPTTLNHARGNAQAVRMNNGSVAIIGGYDGTSELSSIEIVAPNGTVTQSDSSLRQPRSFHRVIMLNNGKIAVIGETTAVDLFDGTNVTDGGTVNLGSLSPVLTMLANGTVLVGDGNISTPDGTVASNSVEIYDPGKGSATTPIPTLYPQSDHAAARLADGTVIMAGGQHVLDLFTADATDAVELFDPSTNSFIDYGTIEAPSTTPLIVPYDGIPNSFLLISNFGGGRTVSVFYPKR